MSFFQDSIAADGSPRQSPRFAPTNGRVAQLVCPGEGRARFPQRAVGDRPNPHVLNIASRWRRAGDSAPYHGVWATRPNVGGMVLLCCLCAVLFRPAAFGELSRVGVKGNQFVTADGKPIVFRGLDTSDPDKLKRNDHWNREYLAAAKSWGANLVRFPVHPSAWRIRGKDNYIKLLDDGVGWAKELGLYVIIDWHSIGNLRAGLFLHGYSELYPDALYKTTRKETLEFWRTMAQHYADDTTVAFFELFNEPATGDKLGDCTWAQWKEIMEEVIAVIRANGGKAVPLVAGFNYGYDLTPVANAPVNAEGIGYVSHPYPMKRKAPWEAQWTKDWGFAAEKYPVFATEIGFCAADDKKAHVPVIGDETYGDAFTSYCDKRGISYSVWCFDPHWGPTLIEDWSFKPTRQGAYFKKVFEQRQR